MNGAKFFDIDEAGLFLDAGIALPSRTLYLGSEGHDKETGQELGVDYKLAEKILKGLHMLNSMDTSEITIIMNNIGGDEYHGLAIYDAIKHSKSSVRIVVYGQTMSMGTVILQAAGRRVMSANSVMMVHMGSLEIAMDQRDIKTVTDEWNRVNHLVDEIYLHKLREKNPRYSGNQLRELLSVERYLSAKECLELGLIDEILM